MAAKSLQLAALLFTVLALGGGLGHVYELPHKLGLSREQYLIVQQMYRGWAWLGIAVIGALIASGALAILLRGAGERFVLAVVATVLIAASLVVFFTITFPINQATSNWTVMPADWESLRKRWEWSHAIDAGLYFGALVAIAVSMLVDRQ